jgi:hypothetical protein
MLAGIQLPITSHFGSQEAPGVLLETHNVQPGEFEKGVVCYIYPSIRNLCFDAIPGETAGA